MTLIDNLEPNKLGALQRFYEAAERRGQEIQSGSYIPPLPASKLPSICNLCGCEGDPGAKVCPVCQGNPNARVDDRDVDEVPAA